MLHGVSPPLLCRMKAKGLPSTIYIAFGKEWYVHFLHRLAECPENILLAAEDLYYSRDSAVQHPYF